ncbi:MAG: hypothetical protein EU529_13175 [Promethearchaeota archaeon]|nr:MAG: hypothetical protein EU529_13175 [Candidatus Lokiarchaeota archaeon]
MFSIIDDLWIFSKDGLPIVEFCKEGKIDKSLLGAFFSAIKSFSKKISSGDELSSFILKDCKFTLVSALKNDAILVCKSDPKHKEKKIHKLCNVIVRIFEETFDSSDINNWDGDLSFFDDFKDKLDLYFKMSAL